MIARYFALPATFTFGLICWWLYALTADIHFPGNSKARTDNGGVSNAVGFNVVLVLLVGLVWGAALTLYFRKVDAERKR